MNVIINATNVDWVEPPRRHIPTVARSTDEVRRMIASTAAAFGMESSDILSERRTQRLAHARHVAMWLVRTKTSLSLMEIGEAFDRDHGTVLHACQNVAAWIRQGGERAAIIESLSNEIHEHR